MNKHSKTVMWIKFFHFVDKTNISSTTEYYTCFHDYLNFIPESQSHNFVVQNDDGFCIATRIVVARADKSSMILDNIKYETIIRFFINYTHSMAKNQFKVNNFLKF